MFTENYNIQYMDLKHKVQILKFSLENKKSSEKNILLGKYLEALAKELDSRYIEEQYLGAVEAKINEVYKKILRTSETVNLELYLRK